MDKRLLAIYALPGLPLAVVGLPVTIFLPALYAQSRDLPLATMSFALLLARLLDFLVDPVVGFLSDRIRTPFGQRRPWIAVGAVLTIIGVRHVFVPPADVSGYYLFGWVTVLYVGWSMATIPYLAWGASLSTDYDRRSLITGAREFCTMAGILVGSLMPAIYPGSMDRSMSALAGLVTRLFPLCVVPLLFMPEPMPSPPERVRRPLRLLWRNGPFRLLMGATLLGGIGTAINGSLVVFYLQQMNLGAHLELVLLYLASAVAGIPIWVLLAKFVGKHRALCYGSLWGCAWFALLPFIPPGSYWLVATVNVMAGSTIGAAPVLGASMAADVIDWDALRSRQNRSGLFFSLWSMATKLTQALGILALPLVEAFGYHVQGPNTPQGKLALTAGYVGVPILFWLAAITLLWNFPIDKRRQARIAYWRESRAVIGA